MPFTLDQNNSFFENRPQTGLSADARARLVLEGFVVEEDFKEEQINQALKNMHVSIPDVPAIAAVAKVCDQNTNAVIVPAVAAVPVVPEIPPMIISAYCALCLKAASTAFHYYQSISCMTTPANMSYTQAIKHFYVEYEAIKKLVKEEKPDVPIIHKNLAPIRWLESFKDCLYCTFGVREMPLIYVICDEVAVMPEANDPLNGRNAYSASGSVLNELIERIDHNDPLFKTDNWHVFSLLEEATRGSVYASTVKSFSNTKNGCDAWNAMISSHAGNDKWEQLQKDKMKFLMNTKWNGKLYSLFNYQLNKGK